MSTEKEKESDTGSPIIVAQTGQFGFSGSPVTMVIDSSGYVAVLDVLGFRSLVSSDTNNDAVLHYLRIIEKSLYAGRIQSIVFSDSIVLSIHGREPSNLRLLCEACSHLMFELLMADIPIRGAIACGKFATSNISGSAFIAGKPIIEAYEFEQRQNWVGIMLTPSTIKAAPIVKDVCDTTFVNGEAFPNIAKYMEWKAFIQRCSTIPFRSDTNTSPYDGFTILPGGSLSLKDLVSNLSEVMSRLQWLKLLAPTSRDQAKYSTTVEWIRTIQSTFGSRLEEYEQWQNNQS